jgi:hypothetical protein
MQPGYHPEQWNRRRNTEVEEPATSTIHLQWEGRSGSGPSRRSRLVSYIFVLGGMAVAAFLVLALFMLYSTGAGFLR